MTKVARIALLIAPCLLLAGAGDPAFAKKHRSTQTAQAKPGDLDARTECIRQVQAQYPNGSGPGQVMERENAYVTCASAKGVKPPY